MPYGETVLTVVFTQNTEYHFAASMLVAVRTRQTGEWHGEHHLLGEQVRGILMRRRGQLEVNTQFVVGGQLWFVVDGRDTVTSEIICIRRPSDAELDHYISF